jgi:ribulose kinase
MGRVVETDRDEQKVSEGGEGGVAAVNGLLNRHLAVLAESRGIALTAELTRDLHVFPDFHGDRSPRADPSLRGMISGLSLADDLDALAILYLATVQAVAHGTRHVIDRMNEAGYRIDTIVATGGGTKNPVFLREHADVTGCRIALPRDGEAVLLGAAILGAVASGDFETIPRAMAAMDAAGEVVEPTGEQAARYHARKHKVFHRMHDDQLAYRGIMGG